MDFASKAYGQFLELFRSMTPAARVTTGLLFLTVVISLAYLFRFQGDVADSFLFEGEILSPRELNDMQIAFGQASLNGFQVKQQRIMVPRGERHLYLKALADADVLPQHPKSATEQMLTSNSPLESRDVRERKARQAKEQDLGNTIRKWDGFESAVVMIEELRKEGGLGGRDERRASVSVRLQGAELTEQLALSIRRFVAHGAGVNFESVNVVDERTGQSFGGKGREGQPLGEESRYAKEQRRYEEHVKQKIEEQLRHIDRVAISVYADLADNISTERHTRKYDSKPITIRSSEYVKDSSSTRAQIAGRVGAAANQVGSNTGLSISPPPPSENTANEKRDEIDNVAGTTHEVSELAGLVPEYIKASISVPRSYFRKVWLEENQAPAGEQQTEPTESELLDVQQREIRSIEDLVANVLPEPPPGEDKFPLIMVRPYTDLPAPAIPGPSVTENASSWFAAHWQTLGLFGLALAGVWLLRSMLRSAESDDRLGTHHPEVPLEAIRVHNPEGGEEETHDVLDEEDDGDDIANSLKARFRHSGRSLRDELTELVREDADAAANVLQNWLEEAA